MRVSWGVSVLTCDERLVSTRRVFAVEAAGGGGLQLFVDANVSVDSALIRQLVNEVLTETVAQMLSQTSAVATAPEPRPEAPESEDKEVLRTPQLPEMM